VHNLRECTYPEGLPRWARDRSDEELVLGLRTMREARPEQFGPTPGLPAGSRLVPDTATMAELLLVYPSWEDHDETYAALLRHASRHGTVRVVPLVESAVLPLQRVLASSGADPARVTIDPSYPVDSIWVRDWGPLPFTGPNGRGWLDARYSPDCYFNDGWPSRAVTAKPVRRVVRTSLFIDGGNLVVDKAGRCYTTTPMAEHNGLGPEAVAAALVREAGCAEVVVLEPLVGNVIDHVDMLLSPAPDGSLLLAAFDPAEDPDNAAVMARNRARLMATPQAGDVVPVLREIRSPATGWSLDGPVVRTWVNLLPFNGIVFVPAYADADPERQAEALRRIRAAYPGREVVLVPSDALIRQGGGVHCIARGLPVGG